MDAYSSFPDELKDYKIGEGSVQFPIKKPLPKELIIRMVKYRKNYLRNQIKVVLNSVNIILLSILQRVSI
jgi:uncharacterized protein YdhG (YjbR/CyaY superfamily)